MKYVIPRLTLGLAHELGLMAATTMAFLIILLGGEMPPWMWLTAFAPVLSMALSRREVRVPPIAGTVLGLGAIELTVGAGPGGRARVASGPACDRCWRRRGDVGADGLCPRCRHAVEVFDRAANASA